MSDAVKEPKIEEKDSSESQTEEDAIDKFILSLPKTDRKIYINACLDEFEATVDSVKNSKTTDKIMFKEARAWGKRQKRLLKLMGYKKHLPVIGGSKVQPKG